MRRSSLVLCAVVVLLAAGVAAAEQEQLPPGSVRVLPSKAGAPATLRWQAAFKQPPAAQLEAYNVDIARGYRFDPRAARGTCALEQARGSTCPAASRIGSGHGQVRVFPPSGSPQEVEIGIDFYIMAAQQPGDIAGLVLAAHEPASGLTFNLVGRMVRRAKGPYGLQLRFTDTAAELPSNVMVQLHHVDVHFGTHRTVTVGTGAGRHRVTYNLLTNPTTCPRRGWPFLLTVAYTTGTKSYAARGACRR